MNASAFIPRADAPIWDLLWANLPERADKTCLIDADRSLSYAEVAHEADRLAARLAALGVVAGDRVIVQFRKSIDEVVAMHAAWRLGAVMVNVNHQWTTDQLIYVASDCRARVAVVAAASAKALRAAELPATLEHVIARGGFAVEDGEDRFSIWNETMAAAGDVAPHQADPGALCAIIYTSGSTGKPKGVMLSHRNIRIGALSVTQYLGLDESDRLLSILPYSFDAGLNQLTTMLLVGGTVVHQPVIFAAEIVATAKRHAVTGIAGVPPLWSMIVRYLVDAPTELPALKRVTNTGGKISPDILSAMPGAFPGARIFLMYGLTESFRSTFLAPDKFAAKMGSIGQAVPHSQVFAVRNGIGRAQPGEQGELVHVGPLISLGYWERPADTAARIRPCPELAAEIGDQNVVWSGDLVEVDADGDLWFVGRMDDMIKTMGFRVSPTEVEDAVARTGLTQESVAFGREDADRGQTIHVAVSLHEGADPEALRAAFRQTMPSYMLPSSVFQWPGIMPRTASGKLDRPSVIAACGNGDIHAIT
ncbi:MAG: AMP-binding protein [Candidatus Devosia phytovorans]|uniref:AMP-binding protein n=1 Tax=Candidatus Devosia phytovorans TaxID=3121372 RepID=A0AAJ5VUN9_9HYPH|nr:AMP-binding protein [Devosia sp.]WEK03709.1 MAG: AMP-binding protein [Devosia sp.]